MHNIVSIACADFHMTYVSLSVLYVNVLTMSMMFCPVLEIDTGIFQLHIFSVVGTGFKQVPKDIFILGYILPNFIFLYLL